MDMEGNAELAEGPVMLLVEELLAEAEQDVAVALYLAATVIADLSSRVSYGLIRTTPYKDLMPPKTPAPPPVE